MLIAPDILIDDFSFEPDVLLRPVIDCLWQAAGWPIRRTTARTEGGERGGVPRGVPQPRALRAIFYVCSSDQLVRLAHPLVGRFAHLLVGSGRSRPSRQAGPSRLFNPAQNH